jgi:hypothetical protein
VGTSGVATRVPSASGTRRYSAWAPFADGLLIQAAGLVTGLADLAGVVGGEEGPDDELAGLDRGDLAADLLDDGPCAAVSPASSWRSTPREPRVRRVVPGSSGVEGAVLAEAEIVAPGVDHVEGALAPGAVEHFAGRFAVHLVGRQQAET